MVEESRAKRYAICTALGMDMASSLTERFLRYVRINTPSIPGSGSFPSSPNQVKLGRLLVRELREIGVRDVKQDKFGYVKATIPSNTRKKVPAILFCSHLDTSPDCDGENIRPIVHRNYRGGAIVLPSGPLQVISPKDFPELSKKTGMDIITSDGSTLLGADNKAGIAELVEAARYLVKNPRIKHGKILLLFVPDEEIGKDVRHLDPDELQADYAYTVDGRTLGTINNETFYTGKVVLEIQGNPMHTGVGNGLMENSIRIAAKIIRGLPHHLGPESAKGRQGFIHLSGITGTMAHSRVIFQLRAFEERELKKLNAFIKKTVLRVLNYFPRSYVSHSFEPADRNIKEVLKDYPFITDFALQAIRRAGIVPRVVSLRGVTTGAGLSFKGLPAANLFTGQHANHGKMEWICVQDMVKAVECIVHLCEIWQEKTVPSVNKSRRKIVGPR